MNLIVYKKSVDTRGNESWLKVGEVGTWRETHEYRTLTKESRRNGSSFVYSSDGRFLCTP